MSKTSRPLHDEVGPRWGPSWMRPRGFRRGCDSFRSCAGDSCTASLLARRQGHSGVSVGGGRQQGISRRRNVSRGTAGYTGIAL